MKEPAGKKKGKGTTGHGNRYLARGTRQRRRLGWADRYVLERYRPIARRRGGKKAIVAAGRSMLVIRLR